MNIVLTGYMGSGKTAVGKSLAEMLDFEFIDTDAMIEKECEMSITEIFEKFGEEIFRKKESEVIKRVSDFSNVVISTGGGAVLNSENIEYLKNGGTVVNLEPDEAVIRMRLMQDDGTRPLIKNSSMEEIFERFNRRKPYYDNCDIKIKVETEKGIKETAEEILMKIGGRI